MTPGRSTVYICPHCGAMKAVWAMASGNTCCGETIWSDAKRYNPMMEYASFVQQCPMCKHYFITRTTNHKRANTIYTFNKGELPYSNLKEALQEFSTNGLKGKDEYTVRLMVLHAYNDLYGNTENKNIPAEELEFMRQNILRLLPLSQDKVLRSELYREIGEFDKCLTTLTNIHPRSEFEQMIVSKIREHCMQEDTKIFTLVGGSERTAVTCADDEPAYDPNKDVSKNEDDDWW